MTLFRIVLVCSAFLIGCESSDVKAPNSGVSDAETMAQSRRDITRSEVEIAMGTVNKLIRAQNPQGAIDRLTQVLENQNISADTRLKLLEERGRLRFENFDTFGAIADFETILEEAEDRESMRDIQDLLNTARGKATSLNFEAQSAKTSRTRRAELLFELGEHGEAINLMQTYALTPNNSVLVAMLQIGYLCDGAEYAGRAFNMVHPNGNQITARFCDSGK